MVLMTMFAIMLYRVAVIVSMYDTTKNTVFAGYAPLITSLTASIINLLAIVILNQANILTVFLKGHNHSNSFYSQLVDRRNKLEHLSWKAFPAK
jgi:hypothetical protein